MGEPSYDVADALQAVLFFHEGGPWTVTKAREWMRITGSSEATTKVLCDHMRKVLARVLNNAA